MTKEQLDEVRYILLDIVKEQAKDEGLFFIAETAPEAYLQQELRRLHRAIENNLM